MRQTTKTLTTTARSPDSGADTGAKARPGQKSAGREARMAPLRSPRGFIAPERDGLVYLVVYKSGSTSVLNILHHLDHGAFHPNPVDIHVDREALLRTASARDTLKRKLGRDLVFTFVRHPLRRAYSAFNEKVHFIGPHSFPKMRERLVKKSGAEFVAEPSLEQHRDTFKRFLKLAESAFAGETAMAPNHHWSPQSFIIDRVRHIRAPDVIGRVERFDRDMKMILQMAGIDFEQPAPRFNEGPPAPWPYDAIVDDEILTIGQRFYRDDFQRFGYQP